MKLKPAVVEADDEEDDDDDEAQRGESRWRDAELSLSQPVVSPSAPPPPPPPPPPQRLLPHLDPVHIRHLSEEKRDVRRSVIITTVFIRLQPNHFKRKT